MTNYDTCYSAIVASDLNPEEKAWCQRALELAERWYEKRGEILPQIRIDGESLWVCDDGGDIEETVRLIQTFFRRWRPHEVASITFAFTCDKPRVDAFGGGAVVFNAERAEWIDTGAWAAKMVVALRERMPASR